MYNSQMAKILEQKGSLTNYTLMQCLVCMMVSPCYTHVVCDLVSLFFMLFWVSVHPHTIKLILFYRAVMQ